MKTRRKTIGRSGWERILFLFLILFTGLLLRYFLFPIESGDYHQFLQKWFAALKQNGGLAAIGMNIGDYMPPYFYLLALLTYLPGSDLFWIKTASCIADVILGYYVMRIVDLKYPGGVRGLMAYAAVLFLPSVFLNSAAWGQCDAMFVSALAACLYYLLVDRPNRAVLAFAVSFVLKLQSVFFAPFLLLLLVKRKIGPRSLILIPAVYILSVIPAAIMGRSFWSLLTVYVSQSQMYKSLCLSLPNFYAFLENVESDPVSKAGVFFAGGVILMLLFLLYRKRFALSKDILVTLAFLFAILVPFVLPHMHERYYYLADVMGIVYVFYFPKKLFAGIIMWISSACSVAKFLFGLSYYPQQLLAIAVFLNLLLLLRHLWQQIAQNPEPGKGEREEANVCRGELVVHQD